MKDLVFVTWNPNGDLDKIFPEKTASLLSGLVPIRGMLKDHGPEGGLMSFLLPDGKLTEIPVRLDEITEVHLS